MQGLGYDIVNWGLYFKLVVVWHYFSIDLRYNLKTLNNGKRNLYKCWYDGCIDGS